MNKNINLLETEVNIKIKVDKRKGLEIHYDDIFKHFFQKSFLEIAEKSNKKENLALTRENAFC